MKKILLIGLLVLAGCTPDKRIKDPNNHITPFGKATPTTKERSTTI
jgi:hypothetical protein